jgi:hypothetical protein
VDGLAEEGLVRHLVRPRCSRRVALLLPGEVDPDHEQLLVAAQAGGGAGDLEARRGVDFLSVASVRAWKKRRKPRENLGEEAHGAQDDPGREPGLLPSLDLRRWLNASAARRSPRSTARTTAETSNPVRTWSWGEAHSR